MLAGCSGISTVFILFTAIHFGCWFEYLKLGEKKIYNTRIDIFIKWFIAVCGFTLMVLGIRHSTTDFITQAGLPDPH